MSDDRTRGWANGAKNVVCVFLQRVSIACYAERCISYSKSVRLSVCHTLERVKTTQATIMGSSLKDSPMI